MSRRSRPGVDPAIAALPIVAAIRRELAGARAAARATRAATQAKVDIAQQRYERVVDAAASVPQRAAAGRDQRMAEAADRHAQGSAALATAATQAAHQAAPGHSGTPWTAWVDPVQTRVGSPLIGAAAPPLRIGTVADTVPALLTFLDHTHLRVTDGPGGRTTGDDLLTTVLLRALGSAPPGMVRVVCHDPERLGGALAGFAPLAGPGLFTFAGPGELGELLDELVDDIRRITQTVLAGEHRSLGELAERTGRRPEPWRVAVLLGTEEPSRHEQAQLTRVLRTGIACGVHVILRGAPDVTGPDEIRSGGVGSGGVGPANARPGGVGSSMSGSGGVGPGVTVIGPVEFHGLPLTTEPPPAELVTSVSRELAERAAAGADPIAFADLLPETPWTQCSAEGLATPIGTMMAGELVELSLADYPAHALIAGPSGTGKTNLIYAMMGGLAARYDPDELEFYLLDFKEGVSFARFAPGRRDPSWLPHVRLVGINVNTDREFGLALLRFLGRTLRERAEAAKRYEVTSLAELRTEDPGGRWPRVVAVVDEFQVLLAGRDALASEAATLLEDLARRGRSQGIHLVLASQDVSGIEALWGRSALVGQFALRVALPKARRVLAENNTAAEHIPRFHAVVNPDSGATSANQVVRVPPASDRDSWGGLQRRLWQARPRGLAAPRLFDGDAVPAFPAKLPTASMGEPVVVLGETIDVAGAPAVLRLPRSPGRNLAVLGTSPAEACAVLAAAGRSLAAGFPEGTARFSVACLDPVALGAAQDLFELLPMAEWYDLDTLPDLLADIASGPSDHVPHFIIGYALDAAAARPGYRPDQLRRVLHSGPEQHTHVLGWWRGVGRLREDLGGTGARLDAIGAWVALDVHGGELAALYPHPGGPAWYPRPWRGLFFDRTVHRTAETIIPYGTP